MNLPKMTENVKNIEKLSKRPNAMNGLDYKGLQQAFDKAGVDIQSFLNNTLIPALDSGIGSVDIESLSEAQDLVKEMAFPVYDPNVDGNTKLRIADILPLSVTVTKAADGTMTSDKTFAHVRATYNAGRPVLCVYTNNKEQWEPVILTLAECENSYAAFTRYTEGYHGDTRLVRITLSASGAIDETFKIDASSIAYSNTTDEESKLAADVKAFLDLLYQKLTGLGASDVSYSGSIGEYDPKNVSAAIGALMNYTDDKVESIPVTKDATADYAASGASSVEAWATMAKTGDATKYRVAAGQYCVTVAGDVYTVHIVDSTYTTWTVRRVEIVSGDDEANAYWSIYTTSAPGEEIYESIGIEGDGAGITLQSKYYQLPPPVTTADNGSFLRVVNGCWKAVQLTNVAEVGA